MVADDYSATVPVPVCDILLKIGTIMWFCDFAFLFNCTPVGRTSDSMMVPT